MGGDGHLDWQAIRDNAYLGIHDMTVVGKALAEAFFGRAPGYSYFFGGSTGGRQALMEAQRFPGDYNGIVALYPSIYRNRERPHNCGRKLSCLRRSISCRWPSSKPWPRMP